MLKLKAKKKPVKADNLKLYMSVKEISKHSGLSEYAIRNLIANKEIPYIEAGRKFLIDRVGLEKYLKDKSKHHLSI